ncbi:MAG: hypothetical protein KIS76_06965 [Pyrinomonadaceae bacterium]|nr:hypothetical protein [Pyrinomonadaceae bacterium]
MTDGNQNPNDLPEEDWAMSEPEIPLVKPKPAAPIDEAAAKLYAPPDTGELDDWDIAGEELSSEPAPTGKPTPDESAPGSFVPPPQSFEVLKPISPVQSGRSDWGMNPPRSDGWKMPEPVFRVTDGEILTRLGKRSGKQDHLPAQEINENLSEIYEPPPTEESSDILAEFEIDDNSADPLEFDVAPAETTAPEPRAANKKSSWSWLVWALAAAGLFLIVLFVGTFFVFYYGMLGFRR